MVMVGLLIIHMVASGDDGVLLRKSVRDLASSQSTLACNGTRKGKYPSSASLHDGYLVENWSEVHARGTFAGMYYHNARGGHYFVGFTKRQSAHLREIRQLHGLCAPERILGFPRPPKYSLLRLEGLSDRIWRAARRGGYEELINSTGEDIEENLVTVGTEHVKRVRQLLIERFGHREPIRVEYEEEPVEL